MRKERNIEKRFSLDSISSYIISKQLESDIAWEKERLDKGNYSQNQHSDHCDQSEGGTKPQGQSQQEIQDLNKQSIQTSINHPFNAYTHFTKPHISPVSCLCPSSPCHCFVLLTKQVEMLQSDLNTAAKVGQALLKTHEDYVLESQKEAAQLESTINIMTENLNLIMKENDKLLIDNNELINQLQESSNELKASDMKIDKLSNDLNQSKDRIIKLNTYMMQAKLLESQIFSLENTRESLQNDLQQTTKDKYLAELKWRKAERMLEKLSNQYERLEEQSYERSRMGFLNNESLKISISELQKNTFDGTTTEESIPLTNTSLIPPLTSTSFSTPIKSSTNSIDSTIEYDLSTSPIRNPSTSPSKISSNPFKSSTPTTSTFINKFPSLPSPPSSGKKFTHRQHNRASSSISKLHPLYEDDTFKDYFNPHHSRNPSTLSQVEDILESPSNKQNVKLNLQVDTSLSKDILIGLPTSNDSLNEVDQVNNEINNAVGDDEYEEDDGTSTISITKSIDNSITNDDSTTHSIFNISNNISNNISTTFDNNSIFDSSSDDSDNSISNIDFSFNLPLRKVASHESILSVIMDNHTPTIPSFYARTKAGIAVTKLSTEITHASPSKLLNPDYSSTVLKSRQLLSAAIANDSSSPRRKSILRRSSAESLISQVSNNSDDDKLTTTWASLLSKLRKSNPLSDLPTKRKSSIDTPPIDKFPIQTTASIIDVSEAMNTPIL